MVQFLRVPVRKLNNSSHEVFIFKILLMPWNGTFKNCTITYPLSHNKCHILRWYEWDLLCKQTPS